MMKCQCRSLPWHFPFDFSLKVKVLAAQSCLTLWDSTNCGPRDSSIHGISQARILEWVAISFSGRWPRHQTQVSRIAGRLFTFSATRKGPDFYLVLNLIYWYTFCLLIIIFKNWRQNINLSLLICKFGWILCYSFFINLYLTLFLKWELQLYKWMFIRN